MPDTKEAITRVTKALNQVFKERGQQLASIGGNTNLPSFNSATGTWQKTGKYPRYLLYMTINNGKLEVGYFSESVLKGRLGAFNGIVKGGKGVPGVLVRLHLVFVRADGSYDLLADWEWLVLLLFAQAQVGSTSSETLSNFLPPKSSVTITNTEVPLATVQLFGLLPVLETIMLPGASDTAITVSYQEVGEAIQRYLTFDYPTTPADYSSTLNAPSGAPIPADAPVATTGSVLTLF